MPSPNRVPSYRRHKQSGQAVVTLPDGLGGRRDVLLGKYGSKESRVEYARVIAEWEAAGRTLPKPSTVADLTVNELLVAFWKHAEQHYRRPDGTPSREIADFKASLRPLKELYGFTPAREFGPLALKAVREKMIGAGWCRNLVNQRIGRVRRVFRWGVENELVPPTVLHGLQAVRGLQRGRSAARETEPVKPVAEAFVNATLPYLLPQVAAMVRLQLLAGMRPGEVVIMRGIDLDTTGKVWLYRPGSDQGPAGAHKTAHRGHKRIVPLGPRAQEVLRPWLRLNVGEYLFQPREAEAARDALRTRHRKTKQTPSQARRRPKRNPKRAPGEHYTVWSYGRAIARACDRAFPPPPPLARREDETLAHWKARLTDADKAALGQWRKEHRWHPHQLRHTKATEIRREAGLDAARAVLGHRSPAITEVYAELDIGKAADIMERLG